MPPSPLYGPWSNPEDVVSSPRALTPRPHTRHRTPSFTLDSIGTSSVVFPSGANPGAILGADGAAFVPGANGGDPTEEDNITHHDSASQVSSMTSTVRRRKNALSDRVKKEAILEKHRLEKERENLEETESKMKEKVERKKNELRRKEGLAQWYFDI